MTHTNNMSKQSLTMMALLLALVALVPAFLSTYLVSSGSVPVGSSQGNETGNSEWTLMVDGYVQHTLNLTLNELTAMPRSTVNAELYCVDNPKTPRTKGNWTGVKLGFILERAGVSPEAAKVALYASDGFCTDLTITTARREDVILAYEKENELLPERLRLVVPGKWGYKWIHSITRIELVNYDFKGFWENRGYSDDADIPANY